jgi:flagellin-like protein
MDRGTTPVVGVTLLVAITVVAATAVGLAATATPGASPPVASVETTADADRNEITISHRGGDTLDIDEVTVDVTVDGEPLARQPPVPFFAATGFRGGPTGPFNPASSSEFGAGDEASFRLATTNEPLLSPGDRITVELRTEEGVVARSSTVAQ